MGFAFTERQKARIEKLNCVVRFVEKHYSGKDADKSGKYCEVIDRDSIDGVPYAYGRGDTDPDCLDHALHNAGLVPKPMTAAQMSDPVYVERLRRFNEEFYAERRKSEGEGENKELEEMAEKASEISVRAAEKKYGAKKPKPVPVRGKKLRAGVGDGDEGDGVQLQSEGDESRFKKYAGKE